MDSTENEPANVATHASPSVESGASSIESIPDIEHARELIIGVLSSTVNGCMKEMGYFPGILQMLQESRHENTVLRDHNAKLHSDNVNLSRIVNQQKDQIALLAVSPPAERDAQLDSLKKQLRSVVVDRDALARNYQHLRMAYEQSRRELAELTAFIQNVVPGRIELVRPGLPPPGMIPVAHPHQDGQLVIPPFTIPSTGPVGNIRNPAMNRPSSRAGKRSMSSRMPAPLSGPMPTSAPAPSSRIRFVSTSTIDTSFSKISLNGSAPNSASPLQGSPVVSSSGPSPRVPPSMTDSPLSNSPSGSGRPTPSAAHVIDLTADEDIPMGDQDGPRKKRRVEEDTMIPDVNPEKTETKLVSPEEQPTGGEEDEAASVDGDAEDELDADGRRSETSCLDLAFEEDDDGGMWCLMCKLRYNHNLTTKAPNAFINVNKRELVQHCEQEHPVGWKKLRETSSNT